MLEKNCLKMILKCIPQLPFASRERNFLHKVINIDVAFEGSLAQIEENENIYFVFLSLSQTARLEIHLT